MSDELLISDMKQQEANAKCAVLRNVKAARVRSNGGYLFYCSAAGGAYKAADLLIPNNLTDVQKLVFSAECFRINMAEKRVPLATELIDKASNIDRPTYWQRVDILVWAVSMMSGDDGVWLTLGEHYTSDGLGTMEENIAYESIFLAATASDKGWEIEQIVKDAVREGWIDRERNPYADDNLIRLTRMGMNRASTLVHPLSLVSGRPVEQLLKEKTVTFVIDTNILIEFNSADKLPWTEICPNVKKIHIVIPSTVVNEIDNHKKLSGKIRRRAHEFSGLARELLKNTVKKAVAASGVEVTISLGPLYKNSELDGDRFALDDNDRRIAAEAAKYIENCPGAILLTDDVNPARFFKDSGLPVYMPPRTPRSWLRDNPFE